MRACRNIRRAPVLAAPTDPHYDPLSARSHPKTRRLSLSLTQPKPYPPGVCILNDYGAHFTLHITILAWEQTEPPTSRFLALPSEIIEAILLALRPILVKPRQCLPRPPHPEFLVYPSVVPISDYSTPSTRQAIFQDSARLL